MIGADSAFPAELEQQLEAEAAGWLGSTSVLYRAPIATGGSETAGAPDSPAPSVTETQPKLLIAPCRPFRDGSRARFVELTLRSGLISPRDLA